MGQGSRWPSVIYPLKESKWGCCCQDGQSVKKKTNSRVKMGLRSRWASVIYPLKESKWGCCCLPPRRVEIGLLLFTPSQSQTSCEQQERNKQQGLNEERVKMGQGSRWASVIYPLKESKMGKGHYGLLLFTPGRVKLAVNTKNETNSRVKMGQGSRWASVIYPLKIQNGLLLFTPDRVKMGLLLFTP